MEHHIGDVCIYSYNGDRTENRNKSRKEFCYVNL